MTAMNLTAVAQHMTTRDSYTDLTSVQAIRQIKDKNLALEKVARQFESMMMREMMKSMRAANEVFAEGNYLSSHDGDMYRDMLDDQLSLTLSQGRGMGIAEVMVRQLQGRFGKTDNEGVVGDDEIADYLENRNHYQGPLPSGLSRVEQTAENTAPEFDGSVTRFVETLYPVAEKAAAALGVDVEVLLAQSALETGWGRKLSGKHNGDSSLNFFNIKADRRWQGEAVAVSTIEIRDGIPVRERADFRAYGSVQHSFEDYVDFIANSSRYEKARQSTDAESYIRHLAEAGYATDTEYADKILRIMNGADLRNAVRRAATALTQGGLR